MSRQPDLYPKDDHNQVLLERCHPAEWNNPTPAKRYNLVVVGAGSAGLVTAMGAAGLGAKVALVERRLMGGDCLNFGCVPSKALIRCARAADEARQGEQYGLKGGDGVSVDFSAVMERMRRLRARISANDSVQRFTDAGVDVFLGEAVFSGPDTVTVGDRILKFKRAAICAGSRPLIPPIEGLEAAGFITNETVFALTRLPRRLVVIGGGPVGCELAQVFRRFGSDVTIISKTPQFLPKEDPDAAAILEERFRRESINVLLGSLPVKVLKEDGAKVVVVKTGDGETRRVSADEILVAAGRAPNVEGMGLEAAGVRFSKTLGVHVNDRLQTSAPPIFAAGDVCMKHKFTHAADAAARIVIANALFLGRRRIGDLNIPWCIYTDPEVAHVGLSEKEAREKGTPIDVYRAPLAEVDRAVTDGEEEGFVKVITRKGKDRILGAEIVAARAGDMISEISVAMAGGVGLKRMADVIHPYPTQAEAIKRTADAFNRTRLTPTLKAILKTWLRWRR